MQARCAATLRRRMNPKPRASRTALVALRAALSAGSAATSGVPPTAGRPRSSVPTPTSTRAEASPMTRPGARTAPLLPAPHAVELPALALGRPAEPGGAQDRGREPAGARRRRGVVLVERARHAGRTAALLEGQDAQLATPLALRDAQPVADAEEAGGLRGLAVDVDLPARA